MKSSWFLVRFLAGFDQDRRRLESMIENYRCEIRRGFWREFCPEMANDPTKTYVILVDGSDHLGIEIPRRLAKNCTQFLCQIGCIQAGILMPCLVEI